MGLPSLAVAAGMLRWRPYRVAECRLVASADESAAEPIAVRERVLAAVGPMLGLLLFALAIAILHRELGDYHYADVVAHLRAIPAPQLGAAVLLTVLGYLSLTGYDTLAFRWIRSPLGYSKIAIASFIAYVFSHNVGLSFFGGSAVRYRMFTSWGVAPGDLARAISFNVITFWLGFFALGGVVLALDPIRFPGEWHPFVATTRPLGVAFLAIAAGYLLLSLRHPRGLHVRGFEIELPGPGMSSAQLVVSSIDWALAASVFYAVLPAAHGLTFAHVLGAFLLAQVAGVVSHVPAGLGVFETVVVLLLSRWLPGDAVLGSAVAYRLVYYLLPMTLAITLFAGFEALERSEAVRRAGSLVARWAPELVPRAFSIATFAAGVVLLLSGATPAAPGRVELLDRLLPLSVLELSHLLGSVTGVALLLLARAIQQRVDAGYLLTLVLLAAGSIFSLLKGLDWEEAALLTAMFLALLPCHRFFYRRSSLLGQSFTPGWITGIALVLLGTGFVVLLAYRNVDYSRDLWWEFAFDSHAPRSLRALAGGGLVLAFFALARLLRPSRPVPARPSAEDVERALGIVRRTPRASAHLALLGDKQLLFHESGDGFVMYGLAGRSWIAMGDPVGPPEVRQELAWRFREAADEHGGLTVFYEVGAEDLPLYLDLGLSLRKLGEEARVPVQDFTLEGGARKGLRQTQRRMEREGASFEVVSADGVPPLLDALQQVSNTWLENRQTREKRFSLGYFDRAYLARAPIAVVRRHGRMVAFANVWAPETREEFSIDLMRYDDDAPSGVMEYLFTELLLWGQKQGYGWFSLGMAPLSGFEHHRLAPLWNRLGALLYRHGENLYNFRGLRAFKEKFDPVWEPRYLASPGGLTLPLVLTQIASLISGGVGGVVGK
jgi:phosphatidylglycerol lysyltransferase